MTEIIGSLAEIDPGYSALFCDLWGCLHDGVRAFPEAVAALEGFRGRGGTVVLLTNSPRPAGDVARQLDYARGAALVLGPRRLLGRRGAGGDGGRAVRAAGVPHRAGARPRLLPRRRGAAVRHRAGAARGGGGDRLHRALRRPDRDAGGLPGDHPLRQDQGAEAPLRQPRHRGRRGRPAHLLRRRDRAGLCRGGRAELLLRQAAPADLRAGAARAGGARSATSCRGTRSSASATGSPPTSRAPWARGSIRSSSPAGWRRRRPARRATAGPDPALLAAFLAEARMAPRLAMAYLR